MVVYTETLWKIPVYYSHIYYNMYLVDTNHSNTQLCIISQIKLFLNSFSTWQNFSPNSASCSLNPATYSYDCQEPQWGFIEQLGKFCTLLASKKQSLYTAPVGVISLSCSIKIWLYLFSLMDTSVPFWPINFNVILMSNSDASRVLKW